MSIFIYADESGVFDNLHNDYFVFGGIIFLTKEDRDAEKRKFANTERETKKALNFNEEIELKASMLKQGRKNKLYRSLNQAIKFSIIVDQKRVLKNIYKHKKSKQRYLDYVFKIGVKNALKEIIAAGKIEQDYSGDLYVFMDEHSTATDGKYEIQEAIEAEFKIGTYNSTYEYFFPPILPSLNKVEIKIKDSYHDALIRAADIVANRTIKIYPHQKEHLDKDVLAHPIKVFISHIP